MSTINPGTYLECGCCGMGFQTWAGYVDQDQDLDYGICASCQSDAAARESAIMDDCIKLVTDSLAPANRAKYAQADREQQEAFVHRAMDAGIITWQIGGRA